MLEVFNSFCRNLYPKFACKVCFSFERLFYLKYLKIKILIMVYLPSFVCYKTQSGKDCCPFTHRYSVGLIYLMYRN